MAMSKLARGSLYRSVAYFMASFVQMTGSFWLGLPLALIATAVLGAALEMSLLRRLYGRDHLTQVLATFAVILIANEAVRIAWGSQPIMLNPPAGLTGPGPLPGRLQYAPHRVLIIAGGLAVARALYLTASEPRGGVLEGDWVYCLE